MVVSAHSSSSSYAPFALALLSLLPKGQKVCIVAADATGHGLSSHRPARELYYMWDYQDDFLGFLEEIGWAPRLGELVEGKVSKQIVMLGHSM